MSIARKQKDIEKQHAASLSLAKQLQYYVYITAYTCQRPRSDATRREDDAHLFPFLPSPLLPCRIAEFRSFAALASQWRPKENTRHIAAMQCSRSVPLVRRKDFFFLSLSPTRFRGSRGGERERCKRLLGGT